MSHTLREHNQISEELGYRGAYRGAVVTVHGMTTRGVWQKELTPCLQDAGFRHVAVDLGFVMLGALRRKTQYRIAEKLLAGYEEQLKHYTHPGAIAHSLGTLGLGTCLRVYPDVCFRRIIVFGSILPCNFDWRELSMQGQVEKVLNETSNSDPWPYRACYFIPGSGTSGRDGFDSPPELVHNKEYLHTGHSGVEYRLHYERCWIPFLRSA